jgi:hypothetical protein
MATFQNNELASSAALGARFSWLPGDHDLRRPQGRSTDTGGHIEGIHRQREGIARAQSEGKYKGRKPLPAEKRAKVLQLAAGTGASRAEIAAEVGIGVASVYRILAARKAA